MTGRAFTEHGEALAVLPVVRPNEIEGKATMIHARRIDLLDLYYREWSRPRLKVVSPDRWILPGLTSAFESWLGPGPDRRGGGFDSLLASMKFHLKKMI